MSELIKLSETLKKCGFNAVICESKEKAYEKVKSIFENKTPVGSVGFGNSVTTRSLGLYELAAKYTDDVYIHSPMGSEEIDRKALTADIYFTSANAVSKSGHIVNIDGTGNRTAATCFGPGLVVYLVGKNKISDTLEDALSRAKETAVKLAKFYNRKTPCAVTGKCEDCYSPECVCSVTTIHRKKPYGVEITVILINEELGL